MSYLSLIIALIMTVSSGDISDSAWLDVYLDNLVAVEEAFLRISWWIVGAVVAAALVMFVIALFSKGNTVRASMGGMSGLTGCAAVFLLTLPFFEWITLLLAKGMASAVEPSGIVNVGKLVVCAVIYLLIGTG